METIAVYCEDKIRTYGIQKRTGLSLCKIRIPVEKFSAWGAELEKTGATGGMLFFATAQVEADRSLQLCLLFEPDMAERFCLNVEKNTDLTGSTPLQIDAPVGLIYFQGPHFGDRYGIADAAFGVLEKNGYTVSASACTGATVCIVLPEQQIPDAEQLFSQTFAGPHTNV